MLKEKLKLHRVHIAAHHILLQYLRPHGNKEVLGQLPFTRLFRSTDSSMVADAVGPQLFAAHHLEEVKTPLPLQTLLEGAEQSAVANDVRN